MSFFISATQVAQQEHVTLSHNVLRVPPQYVWMVAAWQVVVLFQVKVGLIKRSKKVKAPVPHLLVSQCPALKDKLGTDATWTTSQTANTNYQQNGFVNEPNRLSTAKTQVEGTVLNILRFGPLNVFRFADKSKLN